MIGETITHYRILEVLGVGGMGQVFRAEDTRLGRQVALKFLSESLLKDPAALERFRREAKAASSLSHPGICTIYDIGENNGQPFLVMELIEGQTLRERAGGRPLSLDLLIDFGTQISDALDAAHSSGIVHRDIKPANIFITSRNLAKILDFGLAKQSVSRRIAEGVGAGNISSLPTTDNLLLTSPGATLGTIAYMSPEQARGEDLDARTDLFSLGAVLYEMATGRRAFEGATSAVIFDAILNRNPVAPSSLNPELPLKFEEIIAKSLEKSRDLRYQTAAELCTDLKRLKRDTDSSRSGAASGAAAASNSNLPSGTARVTAQPASSPGFPQPAAVSLIRPARWRWIFSLIIGFLLAAAGAFLGLNLHNRYGHHETADFMRMTITPVTSSGNVQAPAISADGKWLAYVQSEKGQSSVSVRQLATGSMARVAPPSSKMVSSLSFSPDGNYVYFVERDPNSDHSALFQLPSLGGAPRQVLFDVDSPISFSPDAKQLAFIRQSPESMMSALMVANADGSAERKLAALNFPLAFSSGGPGWSPDGKRIAVQRTSNEDPDEYVLETVSVDSGAEKRIGTALWSDSAQLAWLRDGTGILFTLPNSKSSFNAQLWEVAYPAGNTLRITNDLNYYAGASITGDDVTLATNQLSFSSSLSIAPAGSAGLSEPRQITSGVGRSDGLAGIAWTSSRIFYTYYASGVLRLASVSPKGGDLRDVVTAGSPAWPSACPKDGSFVFSVIDGAGHAAVWHGDADGVTLKPVTSGPEDERPSCSPDGKFVIYQAVSPAPVRIMKVAIGGGAPVAVSNQHLESPVISPDGRSFAASYEPGPDKPARLAIVGIESGEVQNIYNLPQGAALGHQAGETVEWTKDGRSLLFLVSKNGVGNIWAQTIVPPGKAPPPPRQITNFSSETIWSFGLSPDGSDLIFARGRRISDAVLISHFH
jgi:serine/threonine protein kinase